MSKVVVRDGETLDEALRRFKRQVNKAGTIQECRKRECFLKKNRILRENLRAKMLEKNIDKNQRC